MNLATMNRQRVFLAICSLIGIVSVFLPWATVSAGLFGVSMSESTSGFRGGGVGVMVVFIFMLIISFAGNQTKPFGKSLWLVALALGFIACLLVVVNLMRTQDVGGFGLVEAGRGAGIWIALVAAAGSLISAWALRDPSHDLASSFESLKKEIPFKTISSSSQVSENGKVQTQSDIVAELERLAELRNKGMLTEQEYLNMKSRVIEQKS